MAHDAGAFIRIEDAKILEPLPKEKPFEARETDAEGEARSEESQQHPEATTPPLPEGIMLLPYGPVGFLYSANSIFGKIARQETTIHVHSGWPPCPHEEASSD